MKINKILVITMATVGLLSQACSKNDAKEVANNISKEPTLNGTFESECRASDIMKVAYKEELTFAGNKFTQKQTYYKTNDCKSNEIGGSLTVDGDFVVTMLKDSKFDGNQLKLQLASVKIKSNQDWLTSSMNSLEFCGYNNYKSGEEKNITKATSDWSCPVAELPTSVYGVYAIKDSKLALNEGGLDGMSKSKNEMPKSINENVIYTRK